MRTNDVEKDKPGAFVCSYFYYGGDEETCLRSTKEHWDWWETRRWLRYPISRKGRSGAHKIHGIGAGFVPEVLNIKVYDEIYKASNEDAFETARLLARSEGISVGISSGAALYAAIDYAKRPENEGKVIVALLPDSVDRYYSTALFQQQG